MLKTFGITRRSRCSQSGVGLIEVMVSLAVLSIGLLGMAALQGRALQENQGAYLRSQASILAYDMLERLRANKDHAKTGKYNHSMGASKPKAGQGSAMYLVDLNDWLTNLDNNLPSGIGSVGCTTDGTNQCTVVVQWFDNSITEDQNADGVVDDKDKYLQIRLVSEI